jgi:hypothetical protein
VDHCYVMPSQHEDKKTVAHFQCNCLVKDRLAMLRQAERTRQPKPGSDFQMRRKDETHN